MKKLAIFLSLWVLAGTLSACARHSSSAASNQPATAIAGVATPASVSVVTAK